jgi:sulfofructose kinase
VTETFAIDVLGLGAVAVDELLYVDTYAPADAKAVVSRWERHCGGLTMTALVAAARLGARCSYAGVLGDDDLSAVAVDRMLEEGIDLTYMARRAGARPIHAVIVVGARPSTRNIYYTRDGAIGADEAHPSAEVIQSTRVMFVDPYGPAGMVRAARLARASGIPVVADLEGDITSYRDLLPLIDHLIVSLDFATQQTGEHEPERAVRALWAVTPREVMIVTGGSTGCWFLDATSPTTLRHVPAFDVDVVDTTGCGDVFHGAYAALLARGTPLEERIRVASASAALKATRSGGQAGIPSLDAVEAFLQAQTTTSH